MDEIVKYGWSFPLPEGVEPDNVREMLNGMAARFARPIGVVGGRPVYPIMGGAVDGPGDEKDEDDAEDGDEETDPDEAADEEDEDGDDPVKLKASRDRTMAALKAERELKKTEKKKRVEAENKLRQNAPNPDEATKAIEEARTAAREPLIRKLLTASARSAFLTAGFQGEVSERFIKLIDRDSLDIDDDGEIDGLDEQVAQIKRDFPEKFKRKRTGPADTGKADRDSAPKAKSASERQAEALMRK